MTTGATQPPAAPKATTKAMMTIPTRTLQIAAASLSVAAALTGPFVPLLGAALAALSATVLGVAVLRQPAPAADGPAVASELLVHVETALDALSDAQGVEGDPGRLRLLYAADAAVARAAGAAEDALAVAGDPVMGNDPAPMAVMDVIRVGLSGVDDLSAVRIDASPLISVDGCRARPLSRLIGRLAERHGRAPMQIGASSTADGAIVTMTTEAAVEPAELALAVAAGVTVDTDGATVRIGIGPDLLVQTGPHDHDLVTDDREEAVHTPVQPPAVAAPEPAVQQPPSEQQPPSAQEPPATRRRTSGLLSLFGRNNQEDVGWSTSLRPSAEPTQSQLAGFVNDFVPVEPDPEPTAKVGEPLPPPVPAFSEVNQKVKRGEVAEDYVPPTVDGPLMDLIADLPSAVPQIKTSAPDGPKADALPVRAVRVDDSSLMADLTAELKGLL